MNVSINEYIDFEAIWDYEVCISVEEYSDDEDTIAVIKQFRKDDLVEFVKSECSLEDNKLQFFFSESGGRNESDTQGWSRDYTIIVDAEFAIIKATYEQG